MMFLSKQFGWLKMCENSEFQIRYSYVVSSSLVSSFPKRVTKKFIVALIGSFKFYFGISLDLTVCLEFPGHTFGAFQIVHRWQRLVKIRDAFSFFVKACD